MVRRCFASRHEMRFQTQGLGDIQPYIHIHLYIYISIHLSIYIKPVAHVSPPPLQLIARRCLVLRRVAHLSTQGLADIWPYIYIHLYRYIARTIRFGLISDSPPPSFITRRCYASRRATPFPTQGSQTRLYIYIHLHGYIACYKTRFSHKFGLTG